MSSAFNCMLVADVLDGELLLCLLQQCTVLQPVCSSCPHSYCTHHQVCALACRAQLLHSPSIAIDTVLNQYQVCVLRQVLH
jgi:hypothetical protein